MPSHNLLEQVLESWRIHDEINRRLLTKMPSKGLLAVPTGSRGRDIARQFAHMHNVRVGWLRYNKAPEFEGLALLPTKELLRLPQLRSAFKRSGRAVEKFLRRLLKEGKRLRFFKGEPVRWMCYMISHESHHRGSIMLTLKQNGMRMPEEVAIRDVWYPWYFGEH